MNICNLVVLVGLIVIAIALHTRVRILEGTIIFIELIEYGTISQATLLK